MLGPFIWETINAMLKPTPYAIERTEPHSSTLQMKPFPVKLLHEKASIPTTLTLDKQWALLFQIEEAGT